MRYLPGIDAILKEIHKCAYRSIIEHADYGDEPKANVANYGYEVGKAEYIVAIVSIAC